MLKTIYLQLFLKNTVNLGGITVENAYFGEVSNVGFYETLDRMLGR